MDRNNRPVGRDKTVGSGSAHAGRREGAGPVGGGPVGGGGKRPSGGGSPRSSGGAQGPAGGGFTGGSGGQQRSGGKGGLSPILLIIIVAAVALFGGGGAIGGLFGGLFGGGSSDGGSMDPSPAAAVTPAPTDQGGKVDTTVASGAREKRVKLLGGGRDVTTVMIYMCGTDLESKGGYATKDIQEMLNAKLGDRVNVLVFTGGCKQWQNNVISASRNQIYQVTDGGLKKLWEDELKAMTDPDTLAGFIRWGVSSFPADRYELIFWDHGGGSVSGYGYDEMFQSAGSMTLDGIAAALKKGGCTFDFVGFDACLMATLETALVVEPYADYLIASEETEPGCGWYYTDWLTQLGRSPSMTALEIGKTIADSFVSVCAQAAPRQQATLSVIDLAELAGTVPEPFRDFAQATAAEVKGEGYREVASARSSTKEFAQSSNIDQVDLIHLARNIGTAESRKLAAALESAVKYNATSSNISNAYGVSIYFPYGRTSSVNRMANTYDKIGLDPAYADCIKAFASVEVAGQSVAGGQSGQVNSLFGSLLGTGSSGSAVGSSGVSQLLGSLLGGRDLANVGLTGDQGDFLDADTLERARDFLTDNRFDAGAVRWTDKGGRRVLSLPEDQWDLIHNVELNVFIDDGEGYIDLGLDNVFDFDGDGDLIGEYDGTWLTVDGHVVAYYMLETVGTADNYRVMGRIPAMLNGQRVNLMVFFSKGDGRGTILGAEPDYDEETETDTVSRGLIELKDGDVIDFLCDYYDYQRNFQDAYYLGEPMVVRGTPVVENLPLDNEAYIAAYRLTDLYHNEYWTPAMD